MELVIRKDTGAASSFGRRVERKRTCDAWVVDLKPVQGKKIFIFRLVDQKFEAAGGTSTSTISGSHTDKPENVPERPVAAGAGSAR